MEDFFYYGKLSVELNAALISLIPKSDNPKTVKDFGPISLVGYSYHILSKLLANTMREVMPSVTGPTESDILKHGQILDGILIANEAIHRKERLERFEKSL